uniref:DUF1725 domain-containing protein n=1 Tax=Equus caballus TaxID=9796 RepID=A0A9L0S1T6_HORSE
METLKSRDEGERKGQKLKQWAEKTKTAALFTIAKTWNQPKCPATDDWIKKIWYIYTMEYYSAMKKDKVIPFTTTWMDLEGIILSEISQTEKDELYMTPLIGGS